MIALIRAGAKPADLPVQTPTKYELMPKYGNGFTLQTKLETLQKIAFTA